MAVALIVILIVVALVFGTILSLRRSAKTGMPSQDVLDRATRRARELERREQADDDPHSD